MSRAIIMLLSFALLAMILISGCKNEGEQEDIFNSSASQAVQPSQPALGMAPECKKGITKDPYPGACFEYLDNNADGLCDLGE